MNNLTKNIVLFPFNVLYKINPKLELQLLYLLKCRKRLNLKNPMTYNEKLQWIKLYDKNYLMPFCCDKYTVRKFVSDLGCEEILNDLLWAGTNPEEIPFDSLPEKFVIKVTHGSTFNIICKDKNFLDEQKTVKKLKKWLNKDFLPCYGEWFYGIVKPRIIIEKYLEDFNTKNQELTDYKVFCFNGEPKYIRVDSGRYTNNHCKDIYDINWSKIPNATMGYQNSKNILSKPLCLDEMLEYARKLSAAFLHARVDFYIVRDKIYFGEITFTNGAGFDRIEPESFHREMGDQLELNYKCKSNL